MERFKALRKYAGCVFLWVLLVVLGCSSVLGAVPEAGADSLVFGPFGNVMVYRKTPHPSQVVLFVSGDGGWNLGVVDMAKILVDMDAMVLGIDFPRYQKALASSKGACAYPAADFENLSKYAQKTLGFPRYIKPTLAGYSSGATLVYALLVQAPPNSYNGAVSLGFCPDLILGKPMCHGNGLEWTGPFKGKGYLFSPAKNLSAPWIVVQGTSDQVCDTPATEAFVRKVGQAEIVVLPRVGHGFSVPKNWEAPYKSVFTRLFTKERSQAVLPSSVSDLPLIELPAPERKGSRMAVILSGDGGWAGIDKELGAIFSREGIPVTGLNSLKYFWTRRNPESCARDLERILAHYLNAWNKKEVILLGYSFGADVLPFMVNRLSPELRNHVAGVALISPSHSASFEFRVSDWLSDSPDETAYPVLPELEKLKGHKVVCMAGSDEEDSLCKGLKLPWVKNVIVKGGHHLGGDYSRIARTVLDYIGRDAGWSWKTE